MRQSGSTPSAPDITALNRLLLQGMDTDAADKALQPAFAAISADLHKQPPSACGGGCSATQMPFFLRYSAAWVYAAMATTGVSLMEKRKQWQPAVDLLQQLLGTATAQFLTRLPDVRLLQWPPKPPELVKQSKQ